MKTVAKILFMIPMGIGFTVGIVLAPIFYGMLAAFAQYDRFINRLDDDS